MRNFLLVLFVFLVMFMSCDKVKEQLCDAAIPVLEDVTKKLSDRWECNNDKLYDFFVEPVNAKFCVASKLVKSAIATPICVIAIGALSKMGSAAIASKFECNAELVDKDIKNIDKLCSLI